MSIRGNRRLRAKERAARREERRRNLARRQASAFLAGLHDTGVAAASSLNRAVKLKVELPEGWNAGSLNGPFDP